MDYFESFWSIYPRKSAKKDAKKAASTINPDLWPVIMDALKNQLPRFNKSISDSGSKQYVPLPATWLRGERWEDEIETTQEIVKVTSKEIFIQAVRNNSNTVLPDFSYDIKKAFFRMRIPWAKLKQMSESDILEKFERAYNGDDPVEEEKVLDRKSIASGEALV